MGIATILTKMDSYHMPLFILLVFSGFTLETTGQIDRLTEKWKLVCPGIYLNVFTGFAPLGNKSAGLYTEISDSHDLKSCIEKCCVSDTCNVVFMHDLTCLHVSIFM